MSHAFSRRLDPTLERVDPPADRLVEPHLGVFGWIIRPHEDRSKTVSVTNS